MKDCVVLLGAETASGRGVAKKLRAEHYQCLLLPSGADAAQVRALDASGIVLAGEAEEGTHAPDPALLGLGLPLFAIGYAARVLLESIGRPTEEEADGTVLPVHFADHPLFRDINATERWVSKATYYAVDPPYQVLADSDGLPLVVGDPLANIYLMQFQIERNDPDGTAMLVAFARDICTCTPWWSPEEIYAQAVAKIRRAVGDGQAVCAMSGGLDSTIAALLAKEALGERVHCVFIDTGLLREGEAEESEAIFVQELGLNFRRVDASARILQALRGLVSMADKWTVIESVIADTLAEAARGLSSSPALIKGTNYPDTLSGPAVMPEVPHNTRVVAPLEDLYKDDIRVLGRRMGLTPALIERQSFPGMGLAARVRGEVTAERLNILRRADAIFTEALAEAGQAKRLTRYFAMLSEADMQCTIILRALTGTEPDMNVARVPYDLMERVVAAIRKELPCVEHVLYDMTPGMAEWSV